MICFCTVCFSYAASPAQCKNTSTSTQKGLLSQKCNTQNRQLLQVHRSASTSSTGTCCKVSSHSGFTMLVILLMILPACSYNVPGLCSWCFIHVAVQPACRLPYFWELCYPCLYTHTSILFKYVWLYSYSCDFMSTASSDRPL